jgi:trimethylamine--corrinoid protein Co-methyltransferase
VPTVCAANPDIVTGWGLIDSHNTMSLPQSVIDDEMAGMLRRVNAPVEVSDATLAGDAIATAGPGGSFLGHKETAKRIRAGEHFLPKVSDRLSYEKWAVEGGDEYATACERVETILAGHAEKPPYIDGDKLDALAAICRVDEELRRCALRD